MTRLNKNKLDQEKRDLASQQEELTKLLEVDEAVYNVMKEDFAEIDKMFGVDGKTRILNDDGEVNEIDMVKNSQSGTFFLKNFYDSKKSFPVC